MYWNCPDLGETFLPQEQTPEKKAFSAVEASWIGSQTVVIGFGLLDLFNGYLAHTLNMANL